MHDPEMREYVDNTELWEDMVIVREIMISLDEETVESLWACL